jgi:hypothetical protein
MTTSMHSFNQGPSAHPLYRLAMEAAEVPGTVIAKTAEKMESLLSAGGASLVYAGYPYVPFALDAPKS